jgi:hypothetical protein
MTELVDATEMRIGYEKFLLIRERQKLANTKYRATEKGKIKTYEMHRNFVEKKKGDVEYILQTNMKARERYHIRKAQKLALKEIVLGKTDVIDSLGETLGESSKVDSLEE